jgi:hypothetical protein
MASLEDIPIQRLLFFLDQDFDDSLAILMEDFVEGLADRRSWVIHPPVYVNEEVDGVPTLGGYVSLYSTIPAGRLPRDIELRHLEEVKELIGCLEELSKQYGLTFELELACDHVGAIENGQMDQSLREVLLEEWEKCLDAEAPKG